MIVTLLLNRPLPLPSPAEVFARTQKAYDVVRTFEQDVTGETNGSKATAHISFSRPGRLRVTGTTLFGSKHDLLSDGKATWVSVAEGWKPVESAEMGIATITGVAGNTGTLVPSTLLHTAWGSLGDPDAKKSTVSRETVGGRSLLRVQNSVPQPTTTWVDANTSFVVKTRTVLGDFVSTVVFSKPKVNGAIPASRFKK